MKDEIVARYSSFRDKFDFAVLIEREMTKRKYYTFINDIAVSCKLYIREKYAYFHDGKRN